MNGPCPRYTDKAFPPYSYVPGHFPHPVSDPNGHLYGETLEVPAPLKPDDWFLSRDYLYGIDLFNHGFYWESHEVWEGLWHVAGRRGIVADYLKGLIKLAAAAVKMREGNPRGVQRHTERAKELITGVATESVDKGLYCGVELSDLISLCLLLSARSEEEFKSPQPIIMLEEFIKLRQD